MYLLVYCFYNNLVLCYYFFSCVLKILFSYPCIMNCTQKLYNKTYVYFGVVTSHKIFFSCISTSSLSYGQRFFSKRKLVKTSLCTQLKQTNLEIDIIFQQKVQKKVLMILFFNILWIN